MNNPRSPHHRTLSWPRLHGPGRLRGRATICAGLVAGLLGLLIAAAWADDLLDDMLKNAQPTASAPADITTQGPQTEPASGVVDALGTMKPRTPAGARIGVVELSTSAKYEGRVWTTLETPFRVWVDELKIYRDIDPSLVRKIEVKVNSETLEPDWRWKKEGSDEKIYSGKKYPLVDLGYKFTLLNDQQIEGTVVAPIYCFDGAKVHHLALYKKYQGQLDETLKDIVYIKTITLRESETVSAVNERKTTKLPLLD